MKWLASFGLKRYVASSLSVVTQVMYLIPGGELLAPGIEQLAGIFGITGIAHAGASKTISKATLASISSFISFLLLIAPLIPQLQPFVPLLEKLAALFGAASLGALAANKKRA